MELLLAGLVAGFAATPHCLGMCGGFALHLSRAPRPAAALVRQVLFHVGRTFTYVFLGAVVGAVGLWVVRSGWIPDARRVLVYAAAGVTILFGILMLEPFPGVRLPLASGAGAELAGKQGGRLFASPGALSSLALGVVVGFLPCPLTVALLVAAAGQHSVSGGMLLLGGAGIGTLPGLLVTGLAGATIGGRWRLAGLRVMGLVVILLGLALLFRTLGLLPGHGEAHCC